MPEHILVEEFHLTITISDRTSDADREAARVTLNSRRFRAALRKAVSDMVVEFPTLARVRLAITN